MICERPRITMRLLFGPVSHRLALLLLAVVSASIRSDAQVCATPGKEGHGGTLSGIVNTYYPGTASAAAGATSVTLGTARGASTQITSGDLLLVIQMQDASINSNNNGSYGDGVSGDPGSGYTAANNVGRYEFVRATNNVPTSGGTLNLQGTGTGSGLLNSYTNAVATSSQGQRRFQVIRVPQYASATLSSSLTVAAWNGTTGGVLGLDVTGTLTLGGAVSVDGLGFRPGASRQLTGENGSDTDYRNSATNDAHGIKGEGVAGTPRYLFFANAILDTGTDGYPNGSAARGAPGNAGGGGTDGNPSVNDENSGGGGGGNGGAGGKGGNTWDSNLARGGFGGVAFAQAAADRLVMGGGGGSGTRNNDDGNDSASSGGAGGGIVMIRAWKIAGTGTISADGADAYNDTLNDGGGGGGAGGSILVWVQSGGLTGLTVTATGGRGGDAWHNHTPDGNPGERHGPGGGGGGGVVLLSSAAANVTVTGGANGITTSVNDAFGATPGAGGTSATNLTAGQIPGASSGATCTQKPTGVEIESFDAIDHNGVVLLQWRTGYEADNLGFNLYREEQGQLQQLTRSLIAGSALIAASNLTSGRSYSWTDLKRNNQSVGYWLEDVDLNGKTRWHGPVVPQRDSTNELQPADVVSESQTLENLGQEGLERRDDATTVVERKAKAKKLSAAQQAVQSSIASMPAIKLSVKQEGWYRVTKDDLAAAGLDAKINPQFLQMYVDGREQPIIVSGERDGNLDAGDYIEFYGVGTNSPFTDQRVYWLVVGRGAGSRVKNLSESSKQFGSTNFLCTVERADKSVYFSALTNGDKENFFGAVVSSTPADQSLNLASVEHAQSKQASVEVTLQGVTFGRHQTKITLNGVELGSAEFIGRDQGVATFQIGQALLREGENRVTLRSVAGGTDISVVASIRISYWRQYRALNDSLRFTADAKSLVEVKGFTQPNVRVVDITSAASPLEITPAARKDAGGYTISFGLPGTGRRTLLAFTAQQLKRPLIISDEPSDLTASISGADFIIITTAALRQSAQPLKSLREQQGLRVAIVNVDDIYDEFSAGQKTPYAIREFLRFARTNLSRPARWVLLVGDATYDPKNYLGRGSNDLVPTKLVDTFQMETASDDWLADFDGDALPDLAVGRLPVRTAEQAAAVITKIVQYDQAGFSTDNVALLVADANEDGFDFQGLNNEVRSLLPTNMRVESVNRGSIDDGQTRTRILEALNRGTKIVNYSGHASLDFWRANMLTGEDARTLTNSSELPLFVMMTCLNGAYHDVSIEALSETLLLNAQGGAVAVWASSGLTEPAGQVPIDKELYRQLFGPGRATLGEAVAKAKAVTPDPDVRRTWIFFGDPSMRLK
jgi:peptidase C25-like protein